MRPHWKIISILALGSTLMGANRSEQGCLPEPAATCYPDECKSCHCLGPENYGVNPPVFPRTCNGDFTITIAGFYWNAHQDGMEYAIDNEIIGSDASSMNPELNNLIDAEYLTPNSKYDFGFKFGFGYNSACDGWDIGILWTRFRDGAKSHEEAELEDNHALLPLWSAFQFPNAGNAPILFANDIETFWKVELDIFDIELGREFWTSKFLSMRPHVGLRIAFIDQEFDIEHKGGSWSFGSNLIFNDEVELDNDFKGVGLRGGLDTVWNFGCGFALYGNFALSIVYGRFDLHHDESIRDARSPFSKNKILETKEGFRKSSGMADLALGVQWSTMFCDCQYGFTIGFGWEQHIFFQQNQLWRVMRIGGMNESGIFNNTGENVFHQRRGDLDTQGWTLQAKFEF